MSSVSVIRVVGVIMAGLAIGLLHTAGDAYPVGQGQITLRCDATLPAADCAYIRRLFDTVYPELVRVFGRPSSTITVRVADQDFCCQYFRESDTIAIDAPLNIPQGQTDPYFDTTFTHELAHAFHDAIQLLQVRSQGGFEGIWILEGMAEAATQLVAQRLQGRRPMNLRLWDIMRRYDVSAQLGREVLGSWNCSFCPHQSIPSYASATGLFLLLTFALSDPDKLDFLARLNGQLYRDAGQRGTNITRARFLEAVRAAASGKRIEGLDPTAWIERQPIAFDGPFASGPHLGLLPNDPEDLEDIEVFAFERRYLPERNLVVDLGIGNLSVMVKVIAADGTVMLERTVRTSNEQYEVFPQSGLMSARGNAHLTLSGSEYHALKPGAYQIVAEAVYQGQRLTGHSFALHTGLELEHQRETPYLLGATLNGQGLPVRAAVTPSVGQLVMQQNGAFIVEVPEGARELTLSSGSARQAVLKPGLYARVLPFTVGPDAPVGEEIPFQPPAGQLIFADDFSDPASGWFTWSNDWGEVRYEDGEYSIRAKEGAGHRWGYAPESWVLSDFTLELDARHVSGPSGEYGVIFRYRPPRTSEPGDWGDFYLFALTTRGEYALFRVQGREWVPLVEYTPSAAIRLRPEWNHLQIEAIGPRIRVLVNDQELLVAQDESLVKGRLILFVNAYEDQGGTHVHFDNVKIFSG